MISFLTGDIVDVKEQSVCIDVSGVGYHVTAPVSITGSLKVGDKSVTIHTSLIFSDNRLELYGFMSAEEREVFSLLITVSGIGPKAAVKMMSIPKGRLLEAIAGEDVAALTTIPGIGPKTAKRAILELKDKIGALFHFAPGASMIAVFERGSEAEAAAQALSSLGYSPSEIRSMLKNIPKEEMEKLSAGQIVQLGLKRKE